MPEILEQPQTDRLELEHRNPLQILLMRKILGEDVSVGDQAEWMINNGQKISDLIDHHEHDDVRDLARAGQYEEAAEKLLEFFK